MHLLWSQNRALVFLSMSLSCLWLFSCASSSDEQTPLEEPVEEGYEQGAVNYGDQSANEVEEYEGQGYSNEGGYEGQGGYEDQGYSNQGGYGGQGYVNQEGYEGQGEGYANQSYNQSYNQNYNQNYNNYNVPNNYAGGESYGEVIAYSEEEEAPYEDEAPYNNEELSFDASETAPVTAAELQGYDSGEEVTGNGTGELSETTMSDGAMRPGDPVSLAAGTEEGGMGGMVTVIEPPAQLTWVGYDYRPEEGVVRIEMLTEGTPQYSLFRTQNELLPEIVIRFHRTTFEGRISRDIDASEFISPISYIRVFSNSLTQSADIILTLREMIPMRLYAKEGNLLATFSIPEKYYGNSTVAAAEKAYAQPLQGPLVAEFLASTQLPQGFDPYDIAGDVFSDVPEDGGVEVLTEGTTPVNMPALPTREQSMPLDPRKSQGVEEMEQGGVEEMKEGEVEIEILEEIIEEGSGTSLNSPSESSSRIQDSSQAASSGSWAPNTPSYPTPTRSTAQSVRAAPTARNTSSGSCRCPDDLDSAGRRCGKRSAYSKSGGVGVSC